MSRGASTCSTAASIQPRGLRPTSYPLGGIATNGADLWIVDDSLDKVFHFVDGVSLADGTHAATASFDLDSLNRVPSGIATDGQFVWIVDSVEDKVFKYAASGLPLGNWSLDAGERRPTGDRQRSDRIRLRFMGRRCGHASSICLRRRCKLRRRQSKRHQYYPLASQNTAPRGLSTPLPAWMVALLSPNGDDTAAYTVATRRQQRRCGLLHWMPDHHQRDKPHRSDRRRTRQRERSASTTPMSTATTEITAVDALQVINFMTQQHPWHGSRSWSPSRSRQSHHGRRRVATPVDRCGVG